MLLDGLSQGEAQHANILAQWRVFLATVLLFWHERSPCC